MSTATITTTSVGITEKSQSNLKKQLLFLILLISSFSVQGQYSEIYGKNLEEKIISNHQNNLNGYDGLYTHLSFEVKNFDLLNSNFADIKLLLSNQFDAEDFFLNETDNRLIVNFLKMNTTTDDFLKILKEILYEKGVLLVNYTESVLIKD